MLLVSVCRLPFRSLRPFLTGARLYLHLLPSLLHAGEGDATTTGRRQLGWGQGCASGLAANGHATIGVDAFHCVGAVSSGIADITGKGDLLAFFGTDNLAGAALCLDLAILQLLGTGLRCGSWLRIHVRLGGLLFANRVLSRPGCGGIKVNERSRTFCAHIAASGLVGLIDLTHRLEAGHAWQR